MNIDDLRAAQTRERTTDGLQDLPDSFYREAAEYIADLRERRERAAAEADDPFGDDEVQSLTDEIETAEQVAEAIYERRVGKIVKQASLAAAGMGADAEGLTAEERTLYTDLVARIESNKSRVLDVLAGEADAATDAGPDAHAPPERDESPDPVDVVNDRATDEANEVGAHAADAGAPTPPPDERAPDEGGDADDATTEPSTAAAAMGGGGDGAPLDGDDGQATPSDGDTAEAEADEAGNESDADASADEPDVERSTVRITTDVGEVYGIDERAYTLEADDVVTLPAENAEPLLARDAAEKLD